MRDPDKSLGPHNVLVIRPGDECWVANGSFIKEPISARCVQVALKPAGMGEISITYQCAWWSGSERKCEWLEECEVEPISPNVGAMRIGFAASEN